MVTSNQETIEHCPKYI